MQVNPIPIVLQGEYRIIKGDVNVDSPLLTTAPSTCHVVHLFKKEDNQKSTINVLAHLDDHTSVPTTMDKLSQRLRTNFNTALNNQFSAHVFGGIKDDKYSTGQKVASLTILKQLNIATMDVELTPDWEKRPQILFDTRNGKYTIVINNNEPLAFLQGEEYGKWLKDNEIIDDVNKTMYFAPIYDIKEAQRDFMDVPQCAEKDIDSVEWPIQSERTLAKGLNVVVEELHRLIEKIVHKQKPDIQKTAYEWNFNFLLRLASSDPAFLDLLKFLLEHRFTLGIDLNSAGKTSGTALNVATKRKNQTAIDMLKSYS